MAGLFEGSGFGGQTEVRPYQPNFRDWVAGGLLGMGMPRGSVKGLLGSTGLGSEGFGLVDTPTPAGILGVPFAVDEAVRAAGTPEGALAAAALIPGAKGGAKAGTAAVDAVARRGDEILGLLRGGRGREVTDDMLVMGDPAETARLNAYLYDNYDLPMDEASRAARMRGIGFNQSGFRGLRRPYDEKGGGYYQMFTSSPEDAGEYGSNVLPAAIALRDAPVIDARRSNFNAVPTSGLPSDVRAQLHPQVQGGPSARTDEIAHAARQAGRDGVVIRNVFDNVSDTVRTRPVKRAGGVDDAELSGLLSELMEDPNFARAVEQAPAPRVEPPVNYDPVNVTAVNNPTAIRSRWARFDPRLSHLRNLSAGIGGGVIGLGAVGGLLGDNQAQAAGLLGYSTGGGF